MATSTRGYKKRLFAKWEEWAKELDEEFYARWGDEIDAEIELCSDWASHENFYYDWASHENFYYDWAVEIVLAEARKDIREELDKDIREELDDEFYCGWAAHENFYYDWAAEIDLIEELLSSYAKDLGSELGWCERCSEDIHLDINVTGLMGAHWCD